MWLNDETFRIVVAATPLVSIDLVVENAAGEILLGERRNRPARGFWFVPGGRIRKNETLDAAFRRLTEAEQGQVFERAQASFLGVFEHFYRDSVFSEADAGDPRGAPDTHYVVLAYRLRVAESTMLAPPEAQHGRYRWWRPADMRESAAVHGNTRAYASTLSAMPRWPAGDQPDLLLCEQGGDKQLAQL